MDDNVNILQFSVPPVVCQPLAEQLSKPGVHQVGLIWQGGEVRGIQVDLYLDDVPFLVDGVPLQKSAPRGENMFVLKLEDPGVEGDASRAALHQYAKTLREKGVTEPAIRLDRWVRGIEKRLGEQPK